MHLADARTLYLADALHLLKPFHLWTGSQTLEFLIGYGLSFEFFVEVSCRFEGRSGTRPCSFVPSL